MTADEEPVDDADSSAPSPDESDGILLSERSTDEGLLVAACDPEILGETFEEGRISLTVNEEFYAGERVAAEAVVESLKRAQTANLVGERVVAVAIEAGLIDPETVLDIDGTRHAQLVYL